MVFLLVNLNTELILEELSERPVQDIALAHVEDFVDESHLRALELDHARILSPCSATTEQLSLCVDLTNTFRRSDLAWLQLQRFEIACGQNDHAHFACA